MANPGLNCNCGRITLHYRTNIFYSHHDSSCSWCNPKSTFSFSLSDLAWISYAPEKVWETLCSNRFNLKQQQKRDKQQKRSALASEEFWFIKKQREHVVLWGSGRRRQGILVQWCHLVDWMVQSGLRGLYCGHQSVSFKKTVFEVKRRFEGLQSIRDLGRFLSKYKMAPGTARLLSAARSEAGY